MTEHYSAEQYQQQFEQKQQLVMQLLQPFQPPAAQLFASPKQHFRMRSEFRIWHDGDELYHIMFDQQSRQRIRIEQLPIAAKLINQAMPLLIAAIKQQPILRFKLFQVDYLSTLSGKLLISMLYHKKLDQTWIDAAKQLRQTLQQHGLDLQLIGRAHKQKICLDHDYVDEVLPLGEDQLIYRQVENSFTQPNATVNIAMLNWARQVTQNAPGDLLELYCGNGNFSLALAKNFRRVLATEISKSSVAAAQYNIAANQLHNVTILRLAAEEFTQAINGERIFRRLEGIDLTDYACQTILVDPPRCGLDEQTIQMISQYQTIIYISCNPHTLADNLQQLSKTHQISQLALFDQFPYTPHIETGVVLSKIA